MGEYLTTLFLGAVVGSIYSLAAFGLVLTYRTSGVFNFAQGALGMFFSYVFFQLAQGGRLNLVVGVYDQTWHLPTAVALPLVVLVLAPAFGWLLDVVLFRKLREAGSVVQIVASIGLLVSLVGVAGVVWGAATTLVPRSVISERALVLGDFRATVQQLATLGIVIALGAALLAFLQFSSVGIRIRAVVDRAELCELMGVNSRRVAASSWAMSTGFAALAGILVVPFYGSLDTLTLTLLVVAATAAAAVGRLQSLPYTLLGGLGIGIAQFLLQRHAQGEWAERIRASLPFLVLFIVLTLPLRWPAPSVRSIPQLRARDPGHDAPRRQAVRLAVLVAVLVLPPFLLTGFLDTLLGAEWQGQLALVPPMALVFLSIVVVTGYAGQISLAQGVLAGFGAFVAAHLVADQHWPFLLAAAVAAVVTVPLGALLAWRATRLPPLFLGLATLAFAAAMDSVLTSKGFARGLAGVPFERPGFLTSDRSYYFAALTLFLLCALLVRNLRRGKTGLALAAMRDSQVGLASLGAGVAQLKLVSFCLSAFLAGLGGAWFAGARELATSTDYIRLISMLLLALAVVGGIRTWTGALAGAALYQLLAPIFHQPFFNENIVFETVFSGRLEALLPVFFGLGAIGLARNPHGVIEQTREGFADFKAKITRLTHPPEPAVAGATASPSAAGAGPVLEVRAVHVPNARYYHLGGCVLTTGKEPEPLSAARARKLEACPICDPPAPPPARPPARGTTKAATTKGGSGKAAPARSAKKSTAAPRRRPSG